MITACHSCKYNGRKDPRCISCRRVSHDDIRISKTPHGRSEMVAASPQQEPPTTCTPLDDANESRLRISMATLIGLPPLQFLLVRHILLGGRLSNFYEKTLAPIHKRIGAYRGSERSQAGMMRDAIIERAPFLAPVLASLIKEDQAKKPASAKPSMAKAATEEAITTERFYSALDTPQGDLFENAGIIVPFDNLKRKTRR